MLSPKPNWVIAVRWRLVVASAATLAMCEPVWLQTRCSKLSPKCIAAFAVARRLVGSNAAAATCKIVCPCKRCNKLSPKRVAAIAVAG